MATTQIRREDLANSLLESLRACAGWRVYLNAEENQRLAAGLRDLADQLEAGWRTGSSASDCMQIVRDRNHALVFRKP